jgi:hypothetical protein
MSVLDKFKQRVGGWIGTAKAPKTGPVSAADHAGATPVAAPRPAR